ncbi:MAG: hypothetical protein ACYTBV_12580 [Planctomycetota bacterium]|jgi:hypothetical protein
MSNTTIRTLVLEYVDKNGASHIHEMHIEVLQRRPNTPEHTIRARLSEAVSEGFLKRMGEGFYDIYAEEEDMTSVVSYPTRAPFGDHRYRGNCDGRLIKNLILRYRATKVCDPMEGSGTSRDVVEGLNKYKKKGISYWGGDLRNDFDLIKQHPPGKFDFCWIHPPYWNIIRYSDNPNDLSNYKDYEHFRKFLMICLQHCYEALETGGRLAVLIGDVRRKGKYTPIVKDVLNLPFGELRSIIIKVQHNCTSDRRRYGKLEDPPIKHEYCIVFKKIANECKSTRASLSYGQLEIEEAIRAL